MNAENSMSSYRRIASKPIRRLLGWSLRMFLLAAIAVAGWIAMIIQPFVRPVVSQPPPASAARLQAHVKYLSDDLFPRSGDRVENTEKTVDYIHDALIETGAKVSMQDVMVDGIAYKNVIARFGPAEGALIVVGAHYDSHGDEIAAAMNPDGLTADSHTPGADDNASGVAGLIELAGMLGQHPPSQPVELVAYALEEPPYFRTRDMGSVWHARSLAEAKREVKLVLSLEMIGYFKDAPDSQRYLAPLMRYLYSDRGDFIALVGRFGDFGKMRRAKALMSGASALPIHSINAPALLPGIDFSDHRSYWPHGYAAVMVTDTAFFRNPNYHQADDRYHTLDYARMALVVQAVYALVQEY